jgi:hypothetical protein
MAIDEILKRIEGGHGRQITCWRQDCPGGRVGVVCPLRISGVVADHQPQVHGRGADSRRLAKSRFAESNWLTSILPYFSQNLWQKHPTGRSISIGC